MPSAGDHLVIVNAQMDLLGFTLEDALALVPAELRDEVRALWQRDHDQPIRRTRILSRSGGPRPWFPDWRPAEGYYWRRLRGYLLTRRRRSAVEVASLDEMSDRVLSHIEDPREGGPPEFRVQGLVLGYVQSGKTANITALIAKAADVGYRLVIVLSGMDDGLRKQTQDRLARELGLWDDPAGAGQPDPEHRWVSVTRGELRGGDFDPGNVSSTVLQGGQRVIAVVKKNARILRKLAAWLEGAPPSLPVLVIDDEADQASINTGGNRRMPAADEDPQTTPPDPDEDPSAINALIRRLLNLFRRVSYVAYTATPFANFFIDPEAIDREVWEDLYPRDFIISLPRPPHYVGAERLFGRAALGLDEEGVEPLDVIRIIPEPDVAYLVPPPRGSVGFVPVMCPSLETAFLDYVLAGAALIDRRGDSLASMLVHTTHLTAVQNALADLVREHMATLRQGWLYDRPRIRPVLEDRWNAHFRPLTASLDASLDRTFEQLEASIDVFLRATPDVRILNVRSTDILDYEQIRRVTPNLKVIVVGGNRLSRGLTLEELLVSYYARTTDKYDTLLQMGRWFGYREAYVDLTRLWTTADLASRFRHLALVEEEVRDDVAVYEREGLTPADFGVRVRTHPAMTVTAANKMGSATAWQLDLSNKLRQTSSFRLDDRAWLQANLDAVRRFLAGLGPPDDGEDRPGWTDVPWRAVGQFLGEYRSVQDPASFDCDTFSRYIQAQALRHGELIRWRVSVRSRDTVSDLLGTEDLGIEGSAPIATISRSRRVEDRNSIGVLTTPAAVRGQRWKGDEELGLSQEDIDRARTLALAGTFKLGAALRMQRSPQEGVLLIYPVSRYSKAEPGSENRIDLYTDPVRGCTVIGLATIFPPSRSSVTVEYQIGAAGRSRTSDSDQPN